MIYVRDGNDIIPIRRSESKSKEREKKRRSRSAGQSKTIGKCGGRSASVPPASVRTVNQLPECNVVIEKLSSQQIEDLVLKMKLKGDIRRANLDHLNGEH